MICQRPAAPLSNAFEAPSKPSRPRLDRPSKTAEYPEPAGKPNRPPAPAAPQLSLCNHDEFRQFPPNPGYSREIQNPVSNYIPPP